MLKQQLKEIASNFAGAPAHFELFIEDYTQDGATFMWKDGEEGYYVELDANGKLLSLSKPAVLSSPHVSQQQIAEQFLTAEYPEALKYFTLSAAKETEEGTRFTFEQYVGDMPLATYYCIIAVSAGGEVIDFTYKGYLTTPPLLPTTLAPKETILGKLFEANWTVDMLYLTSDYYSVPTSGLYVVYESPVFYHTFDAEAGVREVETTNYVETGTFVPFPKIVPTERMTTMEQIIGIPDSMEIVRKSEMEHSLKIVWREKHWQAANDKSLDSYMLSRMEDCVKAEMDPSTNQVKNFVWFKERRGDYNYSFEECRYIAMQFVATYYSDYVTYLQMKVEEPSFNDVHRAFFTFPIMVDDYRMDGEFFYVSVNQTTGLIDLLMTPRLALATIEAYKPAPILPLATAQQALSEVDALLAWQSNYDDENPSETLTYTFGHHETKQKIKGIDAVTGKLIVSTF
ncbi:MAG: YcdB/YcdC domain-containing protein [Solibacillus sp.]